MAGALRCEVSVLPNPVADPFRLAERYRELLIWFIDLLEVERNLLAATEFPPMVLAALEED